MFLLRKQNLSLTYQKPARVTVTNFLLLNNAAIVVYFFYVHYIYSIVGLSHHGILLSPCRGLIRILARQGSRRIHIILTGDIFILCDSELEFHDDFVFVTLILFLELTIYRFVKTVLITARVFVRKYYVMNFYAFKMK